MLTELPDKDEQNKILELVKSDPARMEVLEVPLPPLAVCCSVLQCVLQCENPGARQT